MRWGLGLFAAMAVMAGTMIGGSLAVSDDAGGEFSSSNRLSFQISDTRTNPAALLASQLFLTPEEGRSTPPVTKGREEEKADGSAPLRTDSLEVNRLFRRLALDRGRKYHVVLYFLESTSALYTDLSHNGVPIMPNFRRYREKAFVARHHYANFPLSINAFFSVLTSAYEYPDKTFVPCSYPRIRIPTLFEVLKKEKFRTGILHGSSLDNFCRRDFMRRRMVDVQLGFDELDMSAYKPIEKNWQADDRALIEPAVKFLRADPETDPGFLVVMPISPHHPYIVPEERFNLTGEDLKKTGSRKNQFWLQYLNSLHFSDHVFGEFMAALEKNGLTENTVIFVFGDHGEAFYQHAGNYLHSLYVYQENVSVPFIILNPRLFPSRVEYSGVSRAIDIAPTVLDLLEVPAPSHYEGVSLFSSHRQQLAVLHAQWADDIMGIADGDWKYSYRMEDGEAELFHLTADPLEKKNLVPTHREKAAAFRRMVLKARAHSRDFYRRNEHNRLP